MALLRYGWVCGEEEGWDVRRGGEGRGWTSFRFVSVRFFFCSLFPTLLYDLERSSILLLFYVFTLFLPLLLLFRHVPSRLFLSSPVGFLSIPLLDTFHEHERSLFCSHFILPFSLSRRPRCFAALRRVSYMAFRVERSFDAPSSIFFFLPRCEPTQFLLSYQLMYPF